MKKIKYENLSNIRCFFILFFLLISFFLSAEDTKKLSTAAEIEILLDTPFVTYGSAARFILEAADVFTTDSPEEAFDYAVLHGMLPKKNIAYNDSVKLKNLSLLLMRSFNVRGGMMYSMFKKSSGSPASHYSYRELVYLNVIQGRTDPAMLVSGERLIFYVNRIYACKDAGTLTESRKSIKKQQKETIERRETLASEIAQIIAEHDIADTTVEATDEGVMITLSNILFLADSAVLPNSEREKIREIAVIIGSIENVKLQIAGHTALAGSVEGRLQISQQRAQSVADFLVSLGACKAENIIVVGYGGERPVADNSTEEGMAFNRRVEIIILEN